MRTRLFSIRLKGIEVSSNIGEELSGSRYFKGKL